MFEHWRLATASVFETNALPEHAPRDFRSRLVSHNVGHFLIGSSHASPMATKRDSALVGAVGVDHLLFQLYVSGEGHFQAEGRQGIVRSGDLVCFDLSRQHSAILSDLDAISLVVPRALIPLPPRTLDGSHGAIISGTTALGQLLARQLVGMHTVAPELSESEVAPAASLAASIVRAALVFGSGERIEGEQAGSALTLQGVRAFIEDNLADPNLTPAMICLRVGISRSALYRLFEPLNGIANYIRARRLHRSLRMIRSVGIGRGAVARLAFACGFPNEATFARAFRERFGHSPRDAILSAYERGRDPVFVSEQASGNWISGWLESLTACPA